MTSEVIDSRLPPHRLLGEPLLAFGNGGSHKHPLVGLRTHGPHSRDSFGTADIRFALITTTNLYARVRQFLGALLREHQPTDRPKYVPPYPGFQTVFGVGLMPADDSVVQLDSNITSAPDPHFAIASALAAAVRQLTTTRSSWDVLIVALPAAWRQWKVSADGAFDLHDQLKAFAAPLGLPTQIVWEDRALTFKHQCSLAWRLSKALYAKAGGRDAVAPAPSNRRRRRLRRPVVHDSRRHIGCVRDVLLAGLRCRRRRHGLRRLRRRPGRGPGESAPHT